MTRWKAFGLHLLISLLIIGGIALMAVVLWYPYGLYGVTGQDRLLLTMLGIDLVAGPVLTLIAFKVDKSTLRLDLFIIGLCQLAFLGYGLHTLWESRPVFLVASDVRFNLVFANEIDAEELAVASRPEWRRLPWSGPLLVGVRPPRDVQARQDLLFAFLSSGVDIDKLPRYYEDYAVVAPNLLKNATKATSSTHGATHPRVPVVTRYRVGWMLIEPGTGKPLRVSIE